MSDIDDSMDVLDPFKPVGMYTVPYQGQPFDQCPECGEYEFRPVVLDDYTPQSTWMRAFVLLLSMTPVPTARIAQMHCDRRERVVHQHCMNCHYVERDVEMAVET